MGFFIGLLTFVLVINCIALILLVLMQLPKKDAGAGLAFGGGATDALFGAGSGNVLTKATKYAATIFFALALVIGILQSKYHTRTTTEWMNAASSPGGSPPVSALPPATEPVAMPEPPAAAPGSDGFNLETTMPEATGSNASPQE